MEEGAGEKRLSFAESRNKPIRTSLTGFAVHCMRQTTGTIFFEFQAIIHQTLAF
jgi:hypothetical protein